MNTLELLKAARERISSEESWTQGAFAENSDGAPVMVKSPEACRWCAIGALESISPPDEPLVFRRAFRELSATLDDFGWDRRMAAYNDMSSHKQVLFLYDVTIRRLEEQCQK